MRKMMTKEVTFTTIQGCYIEVDKSGKPEMVELAPIQIMGTISNAKAQKMLNEETGRNVTITSMDEETNVYEMAVEEFIKVASIKKD